MCDPQAFDQLVAALRRAVDEHGAPNSFGCKELEGLHGGPPAMQAGKLGRNYADKISDALGHTVRYTNRFNVHGADATKGTR